MPASGCRSLILLALVLATAALAPAQTSPLPIPTPGFVAADSRGTSVTLEPIDHVAAEGPGTCQGPKALFILSWKPVASATHYEIDFAGQIKTTTDTSAGFQVDCTTGPCDCDGCDPLDYAIADFPFSVRPMAGTQSGPLYRGHTQVRTTCYTATDHCGICIPTTPTPTATPTEPPLLAPVVTAPGTVSCGGHSPAQVTLAWTTVPGATHYAVERLDSCYNCGEVVQWTTDLSLTVSGPCEMLPCPCPNPWDEYEPRHVHIAWRVRALRGSEEGPWSENARVEVQAPCWTATDHCGPPTPPPPTPYPPLPGDVTQDGVVTPGDAQRCFQMFLGLAKATRPAHIIAADVCSPNEQAITPADAQAIFNIYMGFPLGCPEE